MSLVVFVYSKGFLPQAMGPTTDSIRSAHTAGKVRAAQPKPYSHVFQDCCVKDTYRVHVCIIGLII